MRSVMLAATALVLLGGGCRQAPTVDDLAVAADALEPPQGWQQVDQERVGRCADPVESCPRIVKVYEVPAEVDFAASATRMLERGA